jgi:phospho-N-acetylmuramoyl-pentapeptide-transferase
MGGIAIVIAAVAAYVVSDLVLKWTNRPGVFTRSGIFVMLAIVGAGLVGFLDDAISVRRERNLGLNKRAKSLGLLVIAMGFPVLQTTSTALDGSSGGSAGSCSPRSSSWPPPTP